MIQVLIMGSFMKSSYHLQGDTPATGTTLAGPALSKDSR